MFRLSVRHRGLQFSDGDDEPYIHSSPTATEDVLVIDASDGTLRGIHHPEAE